MIRKALRHTLSVLAAVAMPLQVAQLQQVKGVSYGTGQNPALARQMRD